MTIFHVFAWPMVDGPLLVGANVLWPCRSRVRRRCTAHTQILLIDGSDKREGGMTTTPTDPCNSTSVFYQKQHTKKMQTICLVLSAYAIKRYTHLYIYIICTWNKHSNVTRMSPQIFVRMWLFCGLPSYVVLSLQRRLIADDFDMNPMGSWYIAIATSKKDTIYRRRIRPGCVLRLRRMKGQRVKILRHLTEFYSQLDHIFEDKQWSLR